MIFDPVRSIFDFSFYKDARRHSPVRCVGYLAYIGFAFSLMIASLIHFKVRPTVLGGAEWLAQSMPTLTFSAGKATSVPPGPLVLHPPKEEKLGLLIDTTRTTPLTLEEMTSKSIVLAITRDALYVSQPDQDRLERRAFAEMKMEKPFVLDDAFYRRGARLLIEALYVFFVPLFWMMFVFWKLAAAMIYSSAGLLINESIGSGLDFPSIFKLSIYAQTPWIVLQAVMLPVRRGFPWPAQVLLGFVITTAFLWKAISDLKEAAPATQP